MRPSRAAAVLLAMAVVPTAPSSGASAPPDDLSPFVLDLDEGVLDLQVTVAALNGSTAETESADEVDVTLAADVFFASGEATLQPPAVQVLRDVAAQLREDAEGTVRVVGHTDSVGDDASNLDLSRRRADAVVAALAPDLSGTAVQLAPEGRGEAEPVAVETTPEGEDDPAARARNRRVTITYDKP